MDQLPHLSPDLLQDFAARNYVGPRMVLAAAGACGCPRVELVRPAHYHERPQGPQGGPWAGEEGSEGREDLVWDVELRWQQLVLVEGPGSEGCEGRGVEMGIKF